MHPSKILNKLELIPLWSWLLHDTFFCKYTKRAFFINKVILLQLKQFNEHQHVLVKIKGAVDSLCMHALHIFLLKVFSRNVQKKKTALEENWFSCLVSLFIPSQCFNFSFFFLFYQKLIAITILKSLHFIKLSYKLLNEYINIGNTGWGFL